MLALNKIQFLMWLKFLGKEIIKDYDINNKDNIEFKSNTIYLLEVKTNIEDLTRNNNEILIK